MQQDAMSTAVHTSAPMKARDEPRCATLSVRVTPSLKSAVEHAATADGRTVSQFVERVLVASFRTQVVDAMAGK